MQLELAAETVERVKAWADPARGVTPDDVINRALDCYEHGSPCRPSGPGAQQNELMEAFCEFRNTLTNTSLEDIVEARHLGLR